MSILEIFVGIIAICLILLVAILIAAIFQIIKVARRLDTFVKVLQAEFKSTLDFFNGFRPRFEEIVMNTKDGTKSIAEILNKVSSDGTKLIGSVFESILKGLGSYILSKSVILVGIKTALKVLIENIIKRR